MRGFVAFGARCFFSGRRGSALFKTLFGDDGPGARLVSKVALLQLAQIDRVHFPAGMALTHVSARVRDVAGAVNAVRATEARVLAALELLVVDEAALAAEHAAAIRARELFAG